MSKSFFLVLGALALAALSPMAQADSVSVYLDESNCTGVGCATVIGNSPYGVVNMTLSGGGNINVDIEMYEPFYSSQIIGIFHGFGFNYNTSYGTAPSINITGLPSGWTTTNPQAPGSNSGFGPFGSFTYAISGPGGSGQTPGSGGCSSTGLCDALSFTVSEVGGTFTSVNQLLASNGSSYFGTDIRNSTGGTTYKLGSDGALATPEPSSILLLTMGTLGMFFVVRRRQQAR